MSGNVRDIALTLLTIGIAVGAFSIGTTTSEPSASIRVHEAASRANAISVLMNSDEFADTHVGYAANPSRQYEAFRIVLVQPDAIRIFNDLTKQATLSGKLYGLCGLYLLDRAAFDRERIVFAKDETTVMTFTGCIRFEIPVWIVVTGRIEDGETPAEFAR